MANPKVPTPHIAALEGEIAETVLLPGDPLRAKFIADNFLTDVKQFNATRNMLGFTGYYNGKRVSVMGTGMGCPSIGIYSYELIHFYGCKNLIRVGTAGALNPKCHVRDMVFGMGACTTSNYVRLMGLPGDYSCIASYELLSRAVESAKELGLTYHVGNVLSSPITVSMPFGSSCTKSYAAASFSASFISSSVAFRLPILIFSRTVPLNNVLP